MNKFDEMREAVVDAQRTMESSDVLLRGTACLLIGRLQSSRINYHTLRALKKELANYNLQTGEWK